MSLRRTVPLLLVGAGLILLSKAAALSAQQDARRLTIWSGVYSEAQADRGAAAYQSNCSPCHGLNLDGVARLKGNDFMERWREFDLASLYEFISKSMPRQRPGSPNRPGSLEEKTYLDILGHIFRSNGFPSGTLDLSPAAMKSIQIEGMDGPQPVPSGALVQIAGCLTRQGNNWMLRSAAEPRRTASSASSTEEELDKANRQPLAQFQFGLRNTESVASTFDPAVHQNEKVQAKGYLTRQAGNNRIDVTSLTALSPACP